MFTNKTSLIIPTKNRSEYLIKLLNTLKNLNLNFNELIIVDSSDNYHSDKINFECKKRNIKYFKTKPSTSFQRNFGINHINPNEFLMFMDDDVILFDDAFEKMNKCIEKYGNDPNIGGFGFNQIEKKKENFIDNFKSLKIFEYLNIYPSTPGKIAKSGWQSKIMNLKNDILGDWVFTTICIYKFQDIKEFKFDETFGEYSYLEDLDFSLNLKKKIKKFIFHQRQNFFILKILIGAVLNLELLK